MSVKPISEMRYPEHVEKMLNGDSDYIKTGYDWQGQDPGWTRFFQAGELSSFILSNYYKSETSYTWETEWIEVFIFPNGYKIKFRAYADPNADVRYYTYFSEYRMFDPDDNIVTIPGSSIGGGANMMISYKDNLFNDIVMYTGWSTHYPQSNPTPNDAPADFRIWFYLGHMDDGYMLASDALNKPRKVAGYLYEGFIGWVSDLETFSDYMASHGKTYYDDLFSDEPIPDEPAGGDDTSHTGGGGGNYDPSSDPIDFPPLPTNGALVSGGIMAHRVARETLLSIMTDLWDTSLFDIDTWQKVMSDPIQAIVSLHALPFSPDVAADENNLFIGNMDMHVKSPKVTSQYKEIMFDPVELKEFWGSALDYSPYTKIELYLPFIKTVTLTPEDVMGNTIEVRYHADVLTGDCIAFVKCGNAVLYRFNGNCKMQIPLTVQSNTAASAIKQQIPQMAASVATGGGMGLLAASAQVAGNVMASKIVTQRSGDISGSIGMMDDFIPYLIIHRPRQSLAKNYNKFKGYPSNVTRKLNTLKGYTEVDLINLAVPGATDTELAEIEALLKEGVII